MRVVLGKAATRDILDIYEHIGKDSKPRARAFSKQLRAKAREIGILPTAFALLAGCEHLDVRRRPFGNYLIIYKVRANRVIVLRVIHGACDLDALLPSISEGTA